MRASSKTALAVTSSDASALPAAAPVRFIYLSFQATYGSRPSVP